MLRFALVLGLSTAFVPIAADSSKPSDHLVQGLFQYVNAERTSFFLIKDGHTEVGPIVPKTIPRQQDDLFADETLGAPIQDCSNVHYLCVKTGRNILAVPREQRTLVGEYEFEGTKFVTVKCLRSVRNFCNVAVIMADCQQITDAGLCKPRDIRQQRNLRRGPVTYFIYNEDFGVTSFGYSDDVLKDEGWIAKVSRNYILQSKFGLLKR